MNQTMPNTIFFAKKLWRRHRLAIPSVMVGLLWLMSGMAQAATIPMTANNQYFNGWVWNKMSVPTGQSNCVALPSGSTYPAATVIQGTLGPQTFDVTNPSGQASYNWSVCPTWNFATFMPPGTSAPPGVDSVNLTWGNFLIKSNTPFPPGSMLGIQDMDAREQARITLRTCSGTAIDPAAFDVLVLSSSYVPSGGGNGPMASATYVPAAGAVPAYWQFQSQAPAGVPNVSLGLLMKSSDICSIELDSPPLAGAGVASSGGYTFFLGTPGPVLSLTKALDPATALPVQPGQTVAFDLAVANASPTITAPSGTQIFEIVPGGSSFAGVTGATTDCAIGAPAGTLCALTLSQPLPPNTSQAVKFSVTMLSTLGLQTEVFNLASLDQTRITQTFGCTTSGSSCQSIPTFCFDAAFACAAAPVVTPAVTLSKVVSSATPARVGAGQDVVYDLVFTNNTPGTTGFLVPDGGGNLLWEIIPQNTVYKEVSANATGYCAAGAPAGTLCPIVSTEPVVYGTPVKVQFTVTTLNPLPANTTSIFNAATPIAYTATDIVVPQGCTFDPATLTGICSAPPVGPACPAGYVCATALTDQVPPPATLTIHESVLGAPGGYSGTFNVSVSCRDVMGNDHTSLVAPAATQSVAAGAAPATLTFSNIPEGDICVVTQGPQPNAPDGYHWSPPTLTQPGPIASGGTTVDIVNPMERNASAGPTPVPALGPWAFALLSMLLMGFAAAAVQRTRTK